MRRVHICECNYVMYMYVFTAFTIHIYILIYIYIYTYILILFLFSPPLLSYSTPSSLLFYYDEDWCVVDGWAGGCECATVSEASHMHVAVSVMGEG